MLRTRFMVTVTCVVLVLGSIGSAPAWAAVDEAQFKSADEAMDKAITFLRGTQNEDGSWSPKMGPAVTALVLNAMIDRPDIKADDPAVQKALKYVLSSRQSDGGIYHTVGDSALLSNYNTAICLSALSRFNDDPEVAKAIEAGLAFLRGIQFQEGGKDPNGNTVDENHPFYGGFGYGTHGRPDGSNTQISVQAFFDNNVECDKDPAMKRALAFVSRLQGSKSNEMYGDKIVNDGGAVYATSIDKDNIGVPQSMASPELIDEAKQGKPVAGLRTYGSMTYAMFKTYVYARLSKDDPRVVDALKWISHNYDLTQNPGMPETLKMQGYYYYLLTFARALDAWGEDHITTADGEKHHWRNELIARLASLQKDDGSWENAADRWMEGDANMVTAFAVLALEHAAK